MEDNAQKTIPVVAAVICREGCYLICRRAAHKRHGGLWEFPGGKVHAGESLPDAVRRELAEELSLTAETVDPTPRFEAGDPGSPFHILFMDTVAPGIPLAHEHEAVGWFTPAELAPMPLAPSDRLFARTLLENSSDG